MVEGVEGLQAELEGGVFTIEPGRPEILEECKVPVVSAGTGEHITSHIAKHARLSIGSELRLERLRDHAGIKPGWRRTKLRIVIHPFLDLERSQCVALDFPADSTAETIMTAAKIH